ncbi:MAG: SCO family protein [Phycisphaerales bacterium]|nr:SCO family protein [Phycisphaerales bacterium]
MNRRQKKITVGLWALLLISSLILIALWSGFQLTHQTDPTTAEPQTRAPLFEVPAFQLTDQRNQPFTRQDLSGQPWVADFIFTRCPGPCPIMSNQMARLQEQLPPNVQLVSFSVDGNYDSPEILAEYARRYNADPQRWHFLTGDTAVIEQVARAMKIAALHGPTPVDMQHGTHFVLVNGNGQVEGYYAHDDLQAQQTLIADAAKLIK